MANLKIKGHKVTLSGNEISGDTYPVKNFIKEYLNGKWNADHKSWIIDLGQVETWTGTCIQPDDDPTPVKVSANGSAKWNGWCNKCHSYCWGDCDAN
jgi:hypothetical protein